MYFAIGYIYCLVCGDADKVAGKYIEEMKREGNLHCHCGGPAIEITEEDWESRIHIERGFPG